MNDDNFFSFFPKKEVSKKLKRAQSLVGFSNERAENDFYPTPPEATHALLQREKFEGLIWEPACGDGAISSILGDYGYDVHSTDLIDRGYGKGGEDFLVSDFKADNIITNPPFSIAEPFLKHALNQTTGKVAFLCKLQFLEGAKRKIIFEASPLKTVYVFSKRIKFHANGDTGKKTNSSMLCFAWFVFDHKYNGEPTISWI